VVKPALSSRRQVWPWLLACCLAVLSPACGGAPANSPAMLDRAADGPARITAQWLQAQPGPRLAGVGCHLLDAANQPVVDWTGLALKPANADAAAPTFDLTVADGAPGSIYLYLDYDPAALALDAVELADGRGADWLLLSIAHREPGVAILGLARVGAPGTWPALKPGPLATVRFAPSPERVYKGVSKVNTDLHSTPELELATAQGGGPLLRWRERNIGDYDNNSQVGVPDITPIAMHYLERTSSSPIYEELALIDGDNNTEINSADLVPIASNFDCDINGYNVYRATGSAPGADSFARVGGEPSITRVEVWDKADNAARRRALVYEYAPPAADGVNTYYVEAWAMDGSLGRASNQVAYTQAPGNLPPVWDSTIEITQLAPVATGLRVTFGSAHDPEGSAVSYYLRYVKGAAVDLAGPQAQAVLLTGAELGAGPPYNYTLALAERGVAYTLALQAQDEQGARTAVMQYSSCYLPGLAVSADPWGCYRADAARSGANPALGPREPLGLAWQAALGLTGRSEPVVGQGGWIGISAGGGSVARYNVADGAPLDPLAGSLGAGPYLLAADGPRVVQGAGAGALLWWTGALPGASLLNDTADQGAPLLLGDYIILADAGGTVRAYSTGYSAQASLAWAVALGSQPADGGCLAPASDGVNIFVGLAGGKLYKLDALSGGQAGSGDAGAALAGDSLALDPQQGYVYAATAEDMLVRCAAADLAVARRWPLAADEVAQGAPVLALHTVPPLALCPLAKGAGATAAGVLAAINLDTGAEAWRYMADVGANVSQIGGGAERIYINTGGALIVLDYAGRLRQTLAGFAGPAQSSPALAEGAVALASGGALSALAPVADTPPQWTGTVGIKSLSVEGNDLRVGWDYATETQGEPVSYAIYYAAGGPPQFDPPATGTTIIPGIPSTGTSHSYLLTGLPPDARYYVAVRAYDGYWDDGPTLELNVNYLAATPPWQREELRLGSGQDLPAGEIYFMRGLVAPDGALHLVYSQRADASLTHVWGGTGAWQHEGANLAAHTASAFDLGWDGGLVLAWGTQSQFGLLQRSGPDTWQNTTAPFAALIPPVNPQIALAIGTDPAIVLTEYVDGVGVESNLDYYAQQAVDDVWGSAYLLDSLEFSGRDLDLVLDPAAGARLWAAYQRGGNNTPDRYTSMQGECCYAWGDGAGGFTLDTLDSGDNAPASDCGKRVQQVLDGDGQPGLAYFDLNSSSAQPLGQLKYAHYNGAAWEVETVWGFDLSFQTGSSQFTYGELGLGLDNAGRAVIAYLARQTWASQTNAPHLAKCYVWVRELDGVWHSAQLTDDEQVFPRDREPCVLLMPPDGSWHVFYASSQHPQDVHPIADKLVHLWRPAP
jgi:hypothetical protein